MCAYMIVNNCCFHPSNLIYLADDASMLLIQNQKAYRNLEAERKTGHILQT